MPMRAMRLFVAPRVVPVGAVEVLYDWNNGRGGSPLSVAPIGISFGDVKRFPLRPSVRMTTPHLKKGVASIG